MADIDRDELEDVEEDLIEDRAYLFASPGSYEAGVHDIVEAVEEQLEDEGPVEDSAQP